MGIWELKGFSNDYTHFYCPDDDDSFTEPFVDIFIMDGRPTRWSSRPRLESIIEKVKKRQKPLADISYIAPGSVVLNPKAYAALKEFLSPFGQFLEVECLNAGGLLGDDAIHSQIHYFYNVTHIVHCIDANLPENRRMAMDKPIFTVDDLPKGAQIFKDPLRVRINIYLTDAAKERLEQLIADAQLTGAVFEQVA